MQSICKLPASGNNLFVMGNRLIIIHVQLIQMRQYLFTVTHTVDISLQFSQHNLIQVLLTDAVTTAGIFPVSVIIRTDNSRYIPCPCMTPCDEPYCCHNHHNIKYPHTYMIRFFQQRLWYPASSKSVLHQNPSC